MSRDGVGRCEGRRGEVQERMWGVLGRLGSVGNLENRAYMPYKPHIRSIFWNFPVLSVTLRPSCAPCPPFCALCKTWLGEVNLQSKSICKIKNVKKGSLFFCNLKFLCIFARSNVRKCIVAPEERCRSGRSGRSRKPLYLRVSRVRIPVSPQKRGSY